MQYSIFALLFQFFSVLIYTGSLSFYLFGNPRFCKYSSHDVFALSFLFRLIFHFLYLCLYSAVPRVQFAVTYQKCDVHSCFLFSSNKVVDKEISEMKLSLNARARVVAESYLLAFTS